MKGDNVIVYSKCDRHPVLRKRGFVAVLEAQLQRWREAGVLDEATAIRILQFEEGHKKTGRWPALLAVGFGTLMLCAGVLLFVNSHWDTISPAARFSLVLAMVAVFHVTAGLVRQKFESMVTALHAAGTIALGAGIFLAGQIFNLEEHWPGGVMLWALGAVLGWVVLRQWPQAFLAALLVPWWITGEWMVRTEIYTRGIGIPAQGLLLLAILYLSTSSAKGDNRPLRVALIWAGCLALIPLTIIVIASEEWRSIEMLPGSVRFIGYTLAYAPALVFTWLRRQADAPWIFGLAVWVAVLGIVSRAGHFRAIENEFLLYLCLAAGSTVLCFWGVHANRKLFINYGSAGFAITVCAFYFSSVFDKLGRAAGLMGMGILFLLGGWALNRLRTKLIVQATAASGETK